MNEKDKQEINLLIVDLKSTVLEQELREGWTLEHKLAVARVLELGGIGKDPELSRHVVHVARAMDHLGISQGDLHARVVAASNVLAN
jgi:hypothetical protein